MEEWKEYRLEKLTIGKGEYGIGASAVPFDSSKYTYLRITDINDDGTLNKQNLMSVDDINACNYILKKNDIVFARTGNSTGRSYFYDGSDGVLVYAGFLIKFSIDDNKVNPRILKYYTHSKPYFDWVHSFDTGGTRGNINAKTYGTMPIILPSRKIQDKIVSILKSFDDKIELNRRINENLEQQAQALFKSWFVDFEPFKDGKFVDSELGMIPEGWKVGNLEELVEVKYGKDHKKLASGTIPVYGSGGIMRYVDQYLYNEESVLIPRKGSLNNVMYVNHPFWTVDTMFYTHMKIEGIAKFIYLLISPKDLLSMNSGSAVPSMTVDILNKIAVIIPPTTILQQFESIVKPLFIMAESLQKENYRLAHLRDTLLPKLMSGELKINDLSI